MTRAVAPERRGVFSRLDLGRAFSAKFFVVGGVVILVSYLSLVPLGYLLWETFIGPDGQLTLQHFREAYSTYSIRAMIRNSVLFALGSTVVATTIGTALAYLTARTDIPFKPLVFAASLVPLVIPGILHTIAWIFLASPKVGLINAAIEPLFGPGFLNIFSIYGMMWIEGLHLSPLVFLLMFAAFRSMDPSLEESAVMSGASRPAVIRRITLPLVRPALYASVLIMMVRGLEAFEVPSLIGIPADIWVFTSRIWRVLTGYPIAYGQAGAYSLSLLVLITLGVYWQSRLSKRSKRFQTVSGKAFRSHPMRLGRWRWLAATLILVYFLVAVVLPLGVLLYASLQPFYSTSFSQFTANFTFNNYLALLDYPSAIRAFKNSLILGLGSATAVIFVMSVAAWMVVRTRLPGRWLVDNLSFLPLMIPGIVMGVALLFVYLRVPLPIYGTLLILFIAYFTRYMPYGMRYVSTSMYQLNAELEESAEVSGATWWQSFRRVVLPLLAPGMLAGWIYIVLVSVRELSVSILLYSPGNEVLSVVIWEMWRNGQLTLVAALGCVMTFMLVAITGVAYKLGAKIGVRES